MSAFERKPDAATIIVPPRLSKARAAYYAAHPAEWKKLVDALPRIPTTRTPTVEPAGSPWQFVTPTIATGSLATPMLLTDGTVIMHGDGTRIWYKLTPDINGNYATGKWSKIALMPVGYQPTYYAAAVLPDGRVIINGGEYNGSSTPVWTTQGAIYDPVLNTWASVAPPAGWTSIGDAQSTVLPNGKYMIASCCDVPFRAALLNPTTLTWSPTGAGKADRYDEEGWSLLQDDTVLTVDAYTTTIGGKTCGTRTERYDQTTGRWTYAGSMPIQLADCSGADATFELGPQITRPNGTLVAFPGLTTGSPVATTIYTTSTKTWSQGPNIPLVNNLQATMADGGAAILPNGKILFPASPGYFVPPSRFFEMNMMNAIMPVAGTSDQDNMAAGYANFLSLPNGQVMMTNFNSGPWIYTPTGAPLHAWAPSITTVPSSLKKGSTYTLTGKQLHGLTQGAAYGDDAGTFTNYPLVRITNTASGHVFYARTSNFSTMSIAPHLTSTTDFKVPLTVESGASTLVVVANGIASDPKAVTITP